MTTDVLLDLYSRLLLSNDVALEIQSVLRLLGLNVGAERLALYTFKDYKIRQFFGLRHDWKSEKALDAQLSDTFATSALKEWIGTLDSARHVEVDSKQSDLLRVFFQKGFNKQLNAHIFPLPIQRIFGGFVVIFGEQLLINQEVTSQISLVIRALGNAISRSHLMAQKSNEVSLQAVFNSLNSGVMVIDSQGLIVVVNKQIEELFDLRQDYFERKPLNELEELFPSGCLSQILHGLELNKLRMHVNPIEFSIGEETDLRHYEVLFSMLDDQQTDGDLLIIRDISYRKQIETENQLSEARLRRVVESV